MPYRRRTIHAIAVAAALVLAACGGEPEPPAAAAPEITPPGTDVYLATLADDGAGNVVVGEPANATRRAGYDNQPYFSPDGSAFWYTAQDDHTGQTDIYAYDIAAGTVERVTVTVPESEYSATPIPGAQAVSVIRVEADSAQRLWRIDLTGGPDEVILPELAPVGYHKWVGTETVVMFVLGSPATLRVGHPATGDVTTVAENIGRSIQNIPSTDHVSFVQRAEDGSTTIMRLDPASGEITEIVAAPNEGDFHTWTPAGTLLMGDGTRLLAWTPDATEWRPVLDLSGRGLEISRLAVSPDGAHIAIVAERPL